MTSSDSAVDMACRSVTAASGCSVISTRGRPPLQKLLVGRVLPWLVANGDREELTMTALGAGSALTTLQTLGRAVLVLHGHKHYATARLLKGLEADDGGAEPQA